MTSNVGEVSQSVTRKRRSQPMSTWPRIIQKYHSEIRLQTSQSVSIKDDQAGHSVFGICPMPLGRLVNPLYRLKLIEEICISGRPYHIGELYSRANPSSNKTLVKFQCIVLNGCNWCRPIKLQF